MPKELIRLGMTFVQYMPVTIVDLFLVKLADFIFGDLSNYGIVRPGVGPLQLKSKTGRSSVIDVGTAGLIKKGVVKVKILFQRNLDNNKRTRTCAITFLPNPKCGVSC